MPKSMLQIIPGRARYRPTAINFLGPWNAKYKRDWQPALAVVGGESWHKASRCFNQQSQIRGMVMHDCRVGHPLAEWGALPRTSKNRKHPCLRLPHCYWIGSFGSRSAAAGARMGQWGLSVLVPQCAVTPVGQNVCLHCATPCFFSQLVSVVGLAKPRSLAARLLLPPAISSARSR